MMFDLIIFQKYHGDADERTLLILIMLLMVVVALIYITVSMHEV